jgi:hypothetical protein
MFGPAVNPSSDIDTSSTTLLIASLQRGFGAAIRCRHEMVVLAPAPAQPSMLVQRARGSLRATRISCEIQSGPGSPDQTERDADMVLFLHPRPRTVASAGRAARALAPRCPGRRDRPPQSWPQLGWPRAHVRRCADSGAERGSIDTLYLVGLCRRPSGGGSGMVCGSVVRRPPKPAEAAAGPDSPCTVRGGPRSEAKGGV